MKSAIVVLSVILAILLGSAVFQHGSGARAAYALRNDRSADRGAADDTADHDGAADDYRTPRSADAGGKQDRFKR